MSNLSVVILSSGYNALDKYLGQYLFGLSQLKSISGELDITVAFGSVSDKYTSEQHQVIKQKLEECCSEAGIKLHFYIGDKSENYSCTINQLIRQTIHFAENYAIFNLDDYRIGSNLVDQVKTLQNSLWTYSDFICTNDIVKSINDHKNENKVQRVEITWPVVDLSNKEKYYREFKWSCFLTFKAQLVARFGPYHEGYLSCGDYDFVNRLLFFNITPIKTPGIAGYFLSVGEGISTKPNSPGIREGYHVLEKFLFNKHPVNIYYGRKFLWRNL